MRFAWLIMSGVLLASGAAAAPKLNVQKKPGAFVKSHALAIQLAFAEAKGARAALKLSALRAAKASALEKKLSAAQRAALARVGARVLAEIHAAHKAKKPFQFSPKLVAAIRSDVQSLGSKDAVAVGALVLLATMDQSASALQSAAQKAQDTDAAVARLSSSVQKVSAALASWGASPKRTVGWLEANGAAKSASMTKPQAETLRTRLQTEHDQVADLSSKLAYELHGISEDNKNAAQVAAANAEESEESSKSIVDKLK
ncbi:MAG: hypothetical protein KC776_00890 [Myxococcales bacterium]|nr:hypothetical protein [Myxococcales bacterium]MCB9579001.1 hypothetical protein [Polyangiaceae bacterium]